MRLARYRGDFPEIGWTRPFEMQNRLQKLFSDLLTPMSVEGIGWSPQVDVLESDGELVLKADLPGLKREDVKLEVTEGMLVLKGEKKEEKEEAGLEYRVVERTYGSFERSFALPSSVDAEQIRAEFRNGMLEVHLPKTAKAAGRRVEITD
jgi:HSP20 family protein